MPEQTTPIRIDHPEADRLSLRISIGACRLKLTGGADTWVSGTYSDPSGKIPIGVNVDGGSAHVRQLPAVESIFGIFEGAPSLELALGGDRPFDLVLEGGASEFDLALGGIPLTAVDIKHGAGQVKIAFADPNPTEMSKIRFTMGAGSLEATGLANANFGELTAEGGAARYELGFDGVLRRSATARVTTGASSVQLTIPASTAAHVRPKATLGSIDAGSGFTTRNGGYLTSPAVAGSSPALDIEATVAVGVLRLRSTG
jgi:hypothetical protein